MNLKSNIGSMIESMTCKKGGRKSTTMHNEAKRYKV